MSECHLKVRAINITMATQCLYSALLIESYIFIKSVGENSIAMQQLLNGLSYFHDHFMKFNENPDSFYQTRFK